MKKCLFAFILSLIAFRSFSQSSKYNEVLKAFLNDSLYKGWPPECAICDTLFINDRKRNLVADQMPAVKDCPERRFPDELDSLRAESYREKGLNYRLDPMQIASLKNAGINIDYSRTNMVIKLEHTGDDSAISVYNLPNSQKKCTLTITIIKRILLYRVYFHSSNSNTTGHFDYRFINHAWKRVNVPVFGQY